MTCDHEFIDSGHCLKCGWTPPPRGLDAITQQQKLELAKLRDAFDDAVALIRDWEDYDPNDIHCSWEGRRDEFLAEHEEAGR